MSADQDDLHDQVDLADALIQRFFRGIGDDAVPLTEAMDDLDGAIEILDRLLDRLLDRVLAGAPEDAANERREIADVLGWLFLARFELGPQDRTDLDAAIRLLRDAGGGNPDPVTAADLGRALAHRYDLDETDVDRDDAISVLRPVCDIDDCDPSLLVTLAELLAGRGEKQSSMADVCDAISYGARSLPLLPDDSPDRVIALYVLGIGHLLRAEKDPASAQADRRAAVVALGQVRDMLPKDDPFYSNVTAWYGMALTARVGYLSESLRMSDALRRRADEAIRVLSECEPRLPDDDPLRIPVRYATALTRAIRYLALEGPADDRQMALSELAEISELPGCDASMSGECHHMCAMLLVILPVNDDFRRVVNRYDSVTHARLMSALETHSGPEADSAQQALKHLDRIPDPGAASRIAISDVLSLRAFALLHHREGGPTEEDLRLAIALAEQAIEATPDDDHDLGMLHAMVSFMRGELANRQGNPDAYRDVVDGLMVAAEKLATDHRMQPMVRGVLGEFAGRYGPGTSPTREASIAAAELVEQALRQVPADHPARVVALTRLGEILLGHTVFDHSAEHLTRIRALLHEAITQPMVDQANQAVNHYLLGMVDGVAALFGGDFRGFDAAVEQLRYAAGLAPERHELHLKILIALAMMLRHRYLRDRNLEWLDASDHYAAAALAAVRASDATPASMSTAMSVALERQIAVAPVMRRISQLDQPDGAGAVNEAIRRLEELSARIDDDELRGPVESDLRFLRPLSIAVPSAGPSSSWDVRRYFASMSEALSASVSDGVRPHDGAEPVVQAMRGQAKVADGYARGNRRLLVEGLDMLFEAWDATISTPPDHRWWGNAPAVLHALCNGLRLKFQLTGDRADLSNIIVRLEDAHREVSEGPIGPLLVAISYQLAEAYRIRDDPNLGDRRRAVQWGLRVMREYARDVLLQNSPDRAFTAALSAADTASVVARWCLDADMPETAVEALEMGRGMVLHAATTEASVPMLLRETGHHYLAKEWEAAGNSAPAPWNQAAGPEQLATLLADLPQARLPSDLRQRVMAAIEGTETERNLLTPPGLAEIASTLRAADADALAYLLAGEKGIPGLGVLAGADGQVRYILLPRLVAGPGTPVEAFADAQSEWLQAERAGDDTAAIPARRRWRGALADMCGWAWTAAMSQLLGMLPADLGRPARLVLVPVGNLGLVPWHAARRTVAHGAVRYACQDAIISYAASARQFVMARRRTPRPWRAESALIAVSGSGYWTRRGISGIHHRFYPDGLLLAGPEATAENVRKLLPGSGSAGAALLHVGTHAEPAEHPLASRLRLDGNEFLSMTDLLRQARSRPADIPGGLIVLAACGTDLTRRDHDEALTLATAFLALGAVGAVGTRWPVKDVPTAVFMTNFHHQLICGEDPAAALRTTQLWMLDQRRVPPDSMEPALAREMRTIDPDAVDTWAAYTYQGRLATAEVAGGRPGSAARLSFRPACLAA